MLRITPFRSAEEAIKYYRGALAVGDYFSQGVLRPSMWHGKTAAMLGLTGEVEDKQFERLANNLHPTTGEQLTPRTRDDRLVAYDFTWSVPKSVTALWAIGGDERIVEAVNDAVKSSMQELEQQVQTRVRAKGTNFDRTTGNLVWSDYFHGTTRPVEGVPDPHLHIHCFVMNVTKDHDEDKFKAAKFRPLKRDAPYYEAAFYSRLARNLHELGYETKRLAKCWEVEGVSPAAIKAFSRRTAEIEAMAAELGITSATQKAKLGAKTRNRKSDELSEKELYKRWHGMIDQDVGNAIKATTEFAKLRGPLVRQKKVTPEQAVNHAIDDRFQLASVVSAARLKEKALRYGLGDVTPELIQDAAAKHASLVHGVVVDEACVTTRKVLAEERELLAIARQGRGQWAAIQGEQPWQCEQPMLNAQQQVAIRHVLTSQDQISIIRGAAGTGKTTLMKEAVRAMKERGQHVTVLAPISEAARVVLRDSGFRDAQTLQHYLDDPKMQAMSKNGGRGKGVVWVDEAGLVGVEDMVKLLRIASDKGLRVVLSGDTRQHAPVARGDALRLIEQHAGIKSAEVLTIVRQQGKYKEAVTALSKGNYARGVTLLDELGAIKEIEGPQRLAAITQTYAETISKGKSALVIAPTRAEGEILTSLIRSNAQTTRQTRPG